MLQYTAERGGGRRLSGIERLVAAPPAASLTVDHAYTQHPKELQWET